MAHVFDGRFAFVGALLRSRFGIPVSVTVSPADMASRTPWRALSRRMLRAFDEAFVPDAALPLQMRAGGVHLATTVVRPVAAPLPAPSGRDEASVKRALRDARPGRLVIGLIWPENRNDLRRFRDAVLPSLEGKPLCVVAGAPNRREARFLLGATGMRSQFQVLPGKLSGGRLAALARCCDAFVAPAASRPDGAGSVAMALALAVSGAPLVTDGQLESELLQHEREAFVVTRGDERSFVDTINRLFALPAVQRHFLGEEFARHALGTRTWEHAAETYAERFAALVGRPAIPAELRAA